MCTHISPCPVTDVKKQAELLLESSELQKAMQMMEMIQDPKAALLKAAQGEGFFGLPGIDSIGIDINGILAGDLSALGLPAGISDLADNLSSLGIDADMISSMVNGNLQPGDFLQIAGAAGVDFSALAEVGITQSTLQSIANGSFSASDALQMAGNLGMQGTALEGLGITPDLIMGIADGNVDPSSILQIAQNAGLDMSALEQVGLGENAIMSLANGGGPEVVLSMLQTAGFDQSPITALGIDASTLGAIATGQLPESAINQLMAGTGIDPTAIVIPGVNGPLNIDGMRPANVQDMISFPISDVPGLSNVLDQAKQIQGSIDFATSAIGSSGIDPRAIISGFGGGSIDLTYVEIAQASTPSTSSSAGIQPSYYDRLGMAESSGSQNAVNSLSGATGTFQFMPATWNGLVDRYPSLNLTRDGINDATQQRRAVEQFTQDNSNTLRSRGIPITDANLYAAHYLGGGGASSVLTQPDNRPLSELLPPVVFEQNPNLRGLNVGQFKAQMERKIGSGENWTPGSTSPGGVPLVASATMATNAMCAADKTLISVMLPPNPFGDDLANIDMAIAGGSLEAWPEAIEDAEGASATTAAHGFARAIVQRPILEAAISATDTFDQMMSQSRSSEDDWAINGMVQTHLMVARAETASMMTALVSVKASKHLNDNYITATPLLPHDSRFAEAIETGVTEPAQARAGQASALKAVSQDQASFQSSAQELVYQHGMVKEALNIQTGLPAVYETVETHEAVKGQVASLEEVIQQRLGQLYGADAPGAWEILRPMLWAESGDYYDGNRYDEGARDAVRLSQMATARAPTTPLGRRVLIQPAERDMPATYSSASETPYSYSIIESYNGILGEDYRIKGRSSFITGGGRDEPATMQPGLNLVGAFQTYLEAIRRANVAALMRRGETEVSMTSHFWTEMLNHAPECLAGPFPTEMIYARPEMFDLSVDCGHLYWSGGDVGDYIDASQLGGADAAIWTSKIVFDRVDQRTGGIDQLVANTQATIQYAIDLDLVGRLDALGHPSSAEHTTTILGTLNDVLMDENFVTQIDFPVEGHLTD
jgi:post-segregation antitoxin (ccd killing protein)